jgi:hypothetical protein
MCARVERLANRLHGLYAELREGSRQLSQGQIHALDQRRTASVVARGLNRSFHVVDYRQQFLQQLLIAEFDLVPLIALCQPLIVFKLGSQPQVLLVEDLSFLCLRSEGILGSSALLAVCRRAIL